MPFAFRSIALLAIAVVLVIAAVVASYRSSVSVAGTAAEGAATAQVLQEARTVLALVIDAESGRGGRALRGYCQVRRRRHDRGCCRPA